MVKVENKETMRLLTRRFMKMNRGRNLIAILAIILTALLFTSLFLGSQSLILSRRATENQQSMSSSHAILQNMAQDTDKEILSALQNNRNIARFGTGKFLGSGISEKASFSMEVRYGDENLAESFNCKPQYGTMPEAYDEIAVSSLILDIWEIPHKLGETVTLTWEVSPNETKTDTFKVCGYWEGDKAVLAQLAWVSREYAEKNASTPTKEEILEGYYNGSLDYCVWFKNTWKINEKTRDLSKAAGFSKEEGFEVNTAYDMSFEDSFSFTSVAVFILFIILAGFLIIYNIFSISVKTDIRVYGLLKNVGTTGKQLKKIVHMQALRLSLVGIPIGLLLGYLSGLAMAPVLAESEITTEPNAGGVVVVSADPWIFLLAALLTLLTVYLSTQPACRMVRKLSPVEALRLADSNEPRRKTKRNTSATWFGMAVQNMAANMKKGFVVMASIAFSLVVVNCIVILVQGYDFDVFKEVFLEADFQIDKLKSMPNLSDTSAITPEIKEYLDTCPYSRETGYVYFSDEQYTLDPDADAELMGALQDDAAKNKKEWNKWQKQIWKGIKKEKKLTVQLYGIDKAAFEKLEWQGEPLSWEDFKSGEKAIIYYVETSMYEPVFYCPAGDTFQFAYKSGETKEYQSFGNAAMPYALEYPFAEVMFLKIIIPADEFIQCTGNENAMKVFIDTDKKNRKPLKQYLEDTVLKEDELLSVFSILDMQESFGRYVGRYYMIGGLLAAILAFIGIMNFFNTVAASILSRKKELALLETVGMTKRQIKKMLVAEGCIYFFGALIFAILIVWFGAEFLLEHTVGLTWYFHIKVTIIPCILFVPVLLLIAVVIPNYQYHKMAKESVVDRIRV